MTTSAIAHPSVVSREEWRARGTESLTDSYRLLDITQYGPQQDFEDSPPGWPHKPTYGKS